MTKRSLQAAIGGTGLSTTDLSSVRRSENLPNESTGGDGMTKEATGGIDNQPSETVEASSGAALEEKLK